MSDTHPQRIAIIGMSTGGPKTYADLFTGMPALCGSIILVQHMPKYINSVICEKIADLTAMRVALARDGDKLADGTLYVAPSEVHLTLSDQNRRITLAGEERVNACCPSIDVTMKSVTPVADACHVGVIMTGMGKDGTAGIKYLKRIGGITIAQEERTCVITSMPHTAIETGAVDLIMTPQAIRNKLIQLFGSC